MNKVFLDANVLMEILFQRSKYGEVSEMLKNYSNFYISFLTCHILMYYTELEKLDPNNTFKLLNNTQILENTDTTFDLATQLYNDKDFEDCIQVATSLENEITDFITLDKSLAKKYSDKLNIILL